MSALGSFDKENDSLAYKMSFVLKEIANEKRLAKSELARRMNVSVPTITRIIDKLIAEGMVVEEGLGESTGGRRPSLVSLNLQENMIVSIDLNPESIYGVVANLEAQIISSFKLPILHKENFSDIMFRAYKIMKTLLEQSVIKEEQVLGIGLAISGMVDRKKNIIERSPHFHWKQMDVVGELSKHTKIPVVFDNISRAMAIGDFYFGIGKEYDNFVVIKVGDGIGSGIIIDGQPFYGAHGISGELGHTLTSSENHLKCVCGKEGCLETIASLRGLKMYLTTIPEEWSLSSLSISCHGDPENLTFKKLSEASEKEDPLALRIVSQMTEHLGIAISNLIHLIDPEVVVFGGEILEGGELFLKPIRDIIHGRAITPYIEQIPLVPTCFKENATVMGGIALVFHKVLNRDIVRNV